MPRLCVTTREQGTQCSAFTTGPSLLELLQLAWLPVRSGCRHSGACGLCRVRIIRGDAGPLKMAESFHLEPDRQAAGERLACQVVPTGDLEVELLAPARTFEPRPLSCASPTSPSAAMPGPPPHRRARGAGAARRLGVAVDLGTTVLSLSLCDLDSGERLADCTGANPQAGLGSDVLSRLQAAVESPEDRAGLAQMVVAAIGVGIWDMTTRAGVPLARIERLFLVGNSAMIALLASRRIEQQLMPDQWDRPDLGLTYDASPWTLAWGLDAATRIEILAPLGGFVGSDLLAAALAVRLSEGEAPALLIDFGTNSELALWDGERLHVTAAAGGPAFEGSGISCGWPAERGAIAHVRQHGDGLAFEVLGGGQARGLCGSGLVDLVAVLVRSGRLSALGRFEPGIPGDGFPLPADPREQAMATGGLAQLRLTKADVDSFQRAKAAIGAGTQALLDSAQLSSGAALQLWLAGAFGAALNLDNARALGLLPELSDRRCHFVSHAALSGCEQAMLDEQRAATIDQMRRRVQLVNLARYADFESAFMDHLYLRPQSNGFSRVAT